MCDARDDADRVLTALTDSPDPLTMDQLGGRTGLSRTRLNSALCHLLLDGKTATVRLRGRHKTLTHYTLKTRDA